MIAQARITQITTTPEGNWKVAVTFYDEEGRRRRYKPIIEAPEEPQFYLEWMTGDLEYALYDLASARLVPMPPGGLVWLLSEQQESNFEAMTKAYLFSMPGAFKTDMIEGKLLLLCPRCELPTVNLGKKFICPVHEEVKMIELGA